MGSHVGAEFHDLDVSTQVGLFETAINDVSTCTILENRQNLSEVTTEESWNAVHRYLETRDVL